MCIREHFSFIPYERAEDTLIIVESLGVKYEEIAVLKNINLEINPGLHLVLGKNGSGKTTLLKTIAGLVKPSSGKVLIFGKDVHKLLRREAVKLVGYVWQNPYAGFLETTVKDEIEFTSKIVGASVNEFIVEILVPKNLMSRSPFTLSGGEAKRVSIASVLAIDQPVWLLDEPFDYLDSDGVEAVTKIIDHGLKKNKIVLVASANAAYLHMLKIDQVVILFNGEIAFKGSIENIDNELLRKFGIPSKAMICG
ncbi:MAG: ABC transporter ATP-binding protein [Ignisphaera sp.]|uniref:ABC transporter ATP-binding protein n=1 Tax=Ignisphaera aggregans TaxID=334771 RepID=A0A7C4NLV2_9CREN